MVFSRGTRRTKNHSNRDIPLSEQGLQDSLKAAQVIFQRHKLEQENALVPKVSNVIPIETNDLDSKLPAHVAAKKIISKEVKYRPVSPNSVSSASSVPSTNNKTIRRPVSPRNVEEVPKKKITQNDIGVAQIAAALAHSYIVDTPNQDKYQDSTRFNEENLTAKSLKDQLKREGSPSSLPILSQNYYDPKPFTNFEMNRRRMEVPQTLKRERIRPLVQPPIERSIPISSKINNEYLDNLDYGDQRSSQSQNSDINAGVNEELSRHLEDSNISIGTNIMPKKKSSNKVKSLKKIFTKGSNNGFNNSISRNYDPLLMNNSKSVPSLIDTTNMNTSNTNQRALSNNPINNGSNSNSSNINTPMRFKTTMRYEDHKKSFNEDKPWKAHKDAKYLSEAERKRYEGMWVSNRFRYLALLYWWPMEDIKNENEADNESNSESIEVSKYIPKKHECSDAKSDYYDGGLDSSNDDCIGSSNAEPSLVQDKSIQEINEPSTTEAADHYSNFVNNHFAEPNLISYGKNDTYNDDMKEDEPIVVSPIESPAKTEKEEEIIPQSSPSYLETVPDYSDIMLDLPEEGLILNLVVKNIWNRSNLPDEILGQIYDLVDTRGDGTLERKSFIVGMWLVDQCLYGRKLPTELDQQIWDSVDRYVMHVIHTKNENASKTKRRKKRNIVGRELKQIKKGMRHVHL